MNTATKLSPTQTEVLRLATYRPDGNIEPLPPALRGGARKKVIDGLLTRALVVADGGHYLLTDAGFAAAGRKRRVATVSKTNPKAILGCRENSKQATVIRMLQQPDGATITQIMAVTGWQAHTVRGTFAGAFKKKLRLSIVSDKAAGKDRVYRIA
jgi:hypothetical protein